MTEKELIGLLAIILAAFRYATYIYEIYRGTTRPHIFSWLLWGILMLIGGTAQLKGGAEAGAWPMLFSGVACILIAVISVKRGEKNITDNDWYIFIAALTAVPAWYITNNPIWAVIIISVVDIVAYIPTIRKTWADPYSEPAFSHSLALLRNGLSIYAIANYTPVTVLYPAVIFVLDAGVLLATLLRRRVVKRVG